MSVYLPAMKNMIKAVYENKKYLLLSILISVLTMVPQYVYFISFNRTIFITTVLVLLFLFSILSKVLFTIFTVYLNIINMLVIHMNSTWGRVTILEPVVELIYFSSKRESLEYLQKYISFIDIFIILHTAIVGYILYKFVRKYSLKFKPLKLTSLVLIILLLGGLHQIKGNILKLMPLSLIHDYNMVVKRGTAFKDRNEFLNNKKIEKSKNEMIYDKVVLIMGESVNKNFMGLYNDKYKTTPFFSNIKNDIYTFNAIAPATQTHLAIPLTLTETTHKDFDAFFKSKSIISDFKANEYKTYWISNQEGAGGKHESSTTTIARESDFVSFQNYDVALTNPDEVLFDVLDEIEINNNSKQMFVFHMMGSHADYDQRSTAEIRLHKNPKNLLEEYENTIYYSDYFIEEVFKKFNNTNKNVLIIYTSDHSETLDENTGGHGFYNSHKESVEIPLVMYSNIKNERLEDLLLENKNGFFNNESLYSIIKYISSISEEKAVSKSPYFISQNLENILDYTKLDYYYEHE
ncbi:phosphoethanolamine transferase [Aurantibacter sp.]|uniref:phosphoethanolamine transferase n=1 Tax=Aurantibacter sp. TaxID=2807103 RepID=UPI0032665670